MSARILVAEDDPSILLSLQFLLAKEGYQVTTAPHGEQAWHLLLQAPPDLALLDVDRKSTRLNSSHIPLSRMPSSA